MAENPYEPQSSSLQGRRSRPKRPSFAFVLTLTLCGLGIIGAVVTLVGIAWFAEGENPLLRQPTANIGLGLLFVAVLVNVPIWLLESTPKSVEADATDDPAFLGQRAKECQSRLQFAIGQLREFGVSAQ